MNKKIDSNKKILIGNTLKKIRLSMGFTQEQVAEELGLAPRYISDIERNKTKGSIDTLIKLCNLYNVTPTYILRDYINCDENFIDDSIAGFFNLKPNEKELIVKIIQYFNESNNKK